MWSLLLLLLLLPLPPLPFDFFCHCSLPVDALEFDMDVVNSPVEMRLFPVRRKPSGGRLRPPILPGGGGRHRRRPSRDDGEAEEEDQGRVLRGRRHGRGRKKVLFCWTCWHGRRTQGISIRGQAPKEEEGRGARRRRKWRLPPSQCLDRGSTATCFT